MKSLKKILNQKKLTTQEEISKFLVGKTVKIVYKRKPHNYGKIGDTFVIEKVANLCIDGDIHAQLKDFCNRVYFSDLELCRKPQTEKIMKMIHSASASSSEHIGLLHNIFR